MPDVLLKHSQLCDIFDCFSIGVMVLSPERKIVEANESAAAITGHAKSELIGEYCHHIFLDPLCGRKCAYLEAIEKGRHSGSFDFEVTNQTNENSNITRVVSPIYGPDNQPLGCIEVFHDHSAFKNLLERVRYDDRRLKTILDHLDIGVLTVDRGGHITLFNSTSESITGYSRGNVLGKSCSKIFGKAYNRDILLFKETIADGKTRSSTGGTIRTRHGRQIPIKANYMALKNETGGIVGGLATISDQSLKYQFNSEIKGRYTYYDMVGKDPAIQKVFEIIPVVASSDATILIEGPTGTGKDLLAKVIHNVSKRANKRMVKVNCAALPDNLLESEMFGYVKGAFTGAERDKPGRFQEADGGTIFLDEIGDLPLALQAKLLRVLEDQEFYPLGSRKTARVDVRIISATNQNLGGLVREKRFREDLYYRLNVMRLELPSLKDRKSDLPLLISHILKRMSATRDVPLDKIANDAMEVLLNYEYPGNIRELENILEHALIVCRTNIIERSHLPLKFQHAASGPLPAEPRRTIENEIEIGQKKLILETLRKHNWNKGRTAAALNINRTTLWRKMKKYGLNPTDKA
jgi:PAS domain S-box-containing protein